MVGLGGKLAIEAEEALLIWGQRLDICVSWAGIEERQRRIDNVVIGRNVECLQQYRPCSFGGGSS